MKHVKATADEFLFTWYVNGYGEVCLGMRLPPTGFDRHLGAHVEVVFSIDQAEAQMKQLIDACMESKRKTSLTTPPGQES